MSPAKLITKLLAMTLIIGACSIAAPKPAEAGWWHHRHRHHFHWGGYYSYRPFYHHVHYRHYSAWPVYRSYYRYPVYYPTYYRTYVPTYVTPVYHGCGYSSWGYWSNNTTSGVLAPTYAKAETKAPRPGSQTVLALNYADRDEGLGKIELNVRVPEGAVVTINDRPTTTKGTERTYVTRDVPSDGQYQFEVRAEFERNGKMQSEVQRVALTSGQASTMTFGKPDLSSMLVSAEKRQSNNTTLRLHVPKDAEVYLEGYQMKQRGDLRVFETTKLRPGQELENYQVRVVSRHNGRELTQVKHLTLVGGESQDIEFDFSATRLASAK